MNEKKLQERQESREKRLAELQALEKEVLKKEKGVI